MIMLNIYPSISVSFQLLKESDEVTDIIEIQQFLTAILSGLINFFFYFSSFTFSQWSFPLLPDFLSDI